MVTEKNLKNDESELEEILAVIRLEINKSQRPANEIILDDVDLRNLLKVSERTTAYMRPKQMITYTNQVRFFICSATY
jgi:hypothetical protein